MKNSKNVGDVLKIHDSVFWGLHCTIFCIRIVFRQHDRNDESTKYRAKYNKSEENGQ